MRLCSERTPTVMHEEPFFFAPLANGLLASRIASATSRRASSLKCSTQTQTIFPFSFSIIVFLVFCTQIASRYAESGKNACGYDASALVPRWLHIGIIRAAEATPQSVLAPVAFNLISYLAPPCAPMWQNQ